MGHVGSIEATYTTNKSILSEELLNAMRKSFAKAAKYLDIETINEDKSAKTKEQAISQIQMAKPEQLGAILDVLQNLNAGKILLANA
ncbi:MAG: hypothetical protein K8823_385 [Cenarchaeum symbiont of Oopsacas minuta]|nr:hypothetical protein [Cenarchaeum symbiont of Oopsacas minuta]